MVNTSDGPNLNCTFSPSLSMTVKYLSTRKSLRQFYEVLDVKQKHSVLRLGAARSKRKAIRAGIVLWYSILKRQVPTQIKLKNKQYL